jgi:hypothetical protein
VGHARRKKKVAALRSRQIVKFVGGALAGPGRAIIGGIATSILGQATGIDDSIGDAIGGVVGDQAGTLLGRFTPEEKAQIHQDLQTAFRDAFCEALYDIGGEACFAQAWKSSERDVPPPVVYPKSVGHHLFLLGASFGPENIHWLPNYANLSTKSNKRWMNCCLLCHRPRTLRRMWKVTSLPIRPKP